MRYLDSSPNRMVSVAPSARTPPTAGQCSVVSGQDTSCAQCAVTRPVKVADCTPDHINTKRHFFWTFFYRFYYWYPIDYSPSPLYCYLFRRSVFTNIKVPDNISLPPSLSRHIVTAVHWRLEREDKPTSIDRNHNTITSSLPSSLKPSKPFDLKYEIAE